QLNSLDEMSVHLLDKRNVDELGTNATERQDLSKTITQILFSPDASSARKPSRTKKRTAAAKQRKGRQSAGSESPEVVDRESDFDAAKNDDVDAEFDGVSSAENEEPEGVEPSEPEESVAANDEFGE